MLAELARNYYLLIMLAVGIGASFIGFRWKKQEQEEARQRARHNEQL